MYSSLRIPFNFLMFQSRQAWILWSSIWLTEPFTLTTNWIWSIITRQIHGNFEFLLNFFHTNTFFQYTIKIKIKIDKKIENQNDESFNLKFLAFSLPLSSNLTVFINSKFCRVTLSICLFNCWWNSEGFLRFIQRNNFFLPLKFMKYPHYYKNFECQVVDSGWKLGWSDR